MKMKLTIIKNQIHLCIIKIANNSATRTRKVYFSFRLPKIIACGTFLQNNSSHRKEMK